VQLHKRRALTLLPAIPSLDGLAPFRFLSLVPVVWACWLLVSASDGAVAGAIEDAERLADLKARVRGDFSRPISGRY
jgi:hypothetical protein